MCGSIWTPPKQLAGYRGSSIVRMAKGSDRISIKLVYRLRSDWAEHKHRRLKELGRLEAEFAASMAREREMLEASKRELDELIAMRQRGEF